MHPNQDPSYNRLMTVDWCKELIQNPAYRVAIIRPPTNKSELEGALLEKTLRTKDGIRAALCLYKVEYAQVTELIVLWDIGHGLNGLPTAVHGGMVATFLDECCGIFVAALTGPLAEKLVMPASVATCTTIWPWSTTATAYLNVTYLKFVPTPSVILTRCHLKKREGRKLFVVGRLEDSSGISLATAEALFVQRRESHV